MVSQRRTPRAVCGAQAVAIAAVAGAAACTLTPDHLPRGDDPAVLACVDALDHVRRTVDEAGVGDAGAARVRGFPYLRVDRFLAAVGDDLGDDPADPAFVHWVGRLRDLDRTATAIELANLPAPHRARLRQDLAAIPDLAGADSPARVADACGERLMAHDLDDPAKGERLREAADVPDHYRTAQRILGLYPLSAIPVALGFDQWKRANLKTFAMAPDALPVEGRLVTYAPVAGPPLDPSAVARILEQADANPLGIPEPGGDDLRRLAESFAPLWRVDVTGGHDRIGSPKWRADGVVVVNEDRPTVFFRTGHAVLDGKPLLQLVYLAWFPERPRSGAFDLLGGHLDGLIWRVTLGHDGRPVVYDSIHPCGCYHLFFPVPPTRRKPQPEDADIREEAEVPAPAPALAAGQRMVLRVATRSHYLQGLDTVSAGTGNQVLYELADAAALRSLPVPGGGRRSLYGPDGLVVGSERLERFLLWPMGIASAGAMRQWGTHATAFVGRRHFDDSDLLDRAFER